jgi:hypothetical protein
MDVHAFFGLQLARDRSATGEATDKLDKPSEHLDREVKAGRRRSTPLRTFRYEPDDAGRGPALRGHRDVVASI